MREPINPSPDLLLSRFLGRVGATKKRLTYFGTKVYFPHGSHIAQRAAHEGTFESHVVHLAASLIKPNSVYLDVGANIGLLSVPILALREDIRAISVEAGPPTFEYLERTWRRSKFRDRWTLVGQAVGAANGQVPFFVRGNAFSAFDGLADTGRGGAARKIVVPMTTLDEIWERSARARVSVMKLDIEGGEAGAMCGAERMIRECRPHIILEWNEENLRAYGRDPGEICEIAKKFGYIALSVPDLLPILPEQLDWHMARSEMILLSPDPRLIDDC